MSPGADELSRRITEAIMTIAEDGMTDGAHHKQWVLDQVVRKLFGGDPIQYRAWRIGVGEWDEGIAP